MKTHNSKNIELKTQKGKVTDNNNIKYHKEKELLQKLLKKILEPTLVKLENSTSEQMTTIASTREKAKTSISTLTKISKQLHEKKEKELLIKKRQSQKHTTIKNNKSLVSILNNNTFNKSKNSSTNQLPKIIRTNKHISSKSNVNQLRNSILNNYQINLFGNNIQIISSNEDINSNRKRNKTEFTLYKNRRRQTNLINNNSYLNNIHNISCNSKKSIIDQSQAFNSNINSKRGSLCCIKNKLFFKKSKTNQNIMNSSNSSYINNNHFKEKKEMISSKNLFAVNTSRNSKNKINKKFKNEKSNSIKKYRGYDNNNKKNNNHSFKENSNFNFAKSNNMTLDDDNLSKLFSLESSTIQKDDLIITNNKLMTITDDTDIDPYEFLNKNLNSITIDEKSLQKLKIESDLNIEEFINNEYFNYILEYLSLNDLILLKSVSKRFHNIILNNFLEKIEKEKNEFLNNIKEIQSKYNNIDIPTSISLDDLELHRTSEKAVNLLNEESINKIFYSNKVPHEDILFIYKIFFYLINNPIKNISINEKEKLWEECRQFFIKEGKGKTGNLLLDIIKNKKICYNGENIYKIYKMTKNNLNKIIPAYFSKICGTTGLFVFYIKDILDFFGISSNTKAINKNVIVTYQLIADNLNNHYIQLKKFLE